MQTSRPGSQVGFAASQPQPLFGGGQSVMNGGGGSWVSVQGSQIPIGQASQISSQPLYEDIPLQTGNLNAYQARENILNVDVDNAHPSASQQPRAPRSTISASGGAVKKAAQPPRPNIPNSTPAVNTAPAASQLPPPVPEDIDDDDEEDADIIMAVDYRGRRLGCCFYTEVDETLWFMNDLVVYGGGTAASVADGANGAGGLIAAGKEILEGCTLILR